MLPLPLEYHAILKSEWILCLYSQSKYFLFQTSGPSLPMPLEDHSMVRLGKGQAILGGRSYDVYQAKIYSLTCSNRNCILSLLDRELSVPKGYFVAIPIPDTISGCITDGRNIFQKIQNYLFKQWYFVTKIVLTYCERNCSELPL